MSPSTLLKWLFAALGAIFVALVLYLSAADLGWLKPRVESAITAATGREFSIDGAMSLRLLWQPSVEIEDARLANAAWGSEPTMFTLGHLSGRINLWSLLSGPARIEELRLRDVVLLLERDAAGESNWGSGTAPAPEHESDARVIGTDEVPVIVEFAEIRNVKVTRHLRDGRTRQASIEALDITTDAGQSLALAGTGAVNDLPFEVSGRVGTVAALRAGSGIGIDLRARLGQLQLETNGTIADLETVLGTDLRLLVTANDIGPILDTLDVDAPLAGALRVDTGVKPDGAVTRFTLNASAGDLRAAGEATFHSGKAVDFELTVPALDRFGTAFGISGLPAGDLAVSGAAQMQRGAVGFDPLSIRLGDAELRAFGTAALDRRSAQEWTIKAQAANLAFLHTRLPAQPFAGSGTVSIGPGRIELKALEATLGDSDVSGELTLVQGDRPRLSARLTARRVDLTPFIGAGEQEGAVDTATASARGAAASGRKFVFSRDPLLFDRIGRRNVDFDATIARLRFGTSELQDVKAIVELNDGTLALKSRAASPAGGTATAKLDVTAVDGSAELKLRTTVRDLRVNLLSGPGMETSQLPPVGVRLDVTASGRSPHALAANAQGRLLLTQGAGRIANTLMGRLSGDLVVQLFRALNPFAAHEAYTNWQCTVLAFDIENGVADIAAMLAQTEKVKIVGSGSIDLDTEKLAIVFNTKPRQGVGVSADMFVTPFVQLSGTLARPHVGLNTKGTLITGGAAVATGGLSLLVTGLADRLTGTKDDCATALAAVDNIPPLDD